MEDSFFGFNTTRSADDEKGEGGILDLSEDEYDALNDETFGSAINGDWETQHESMVRMDGKKDEVNGSASNENNGQYNDYDDLEQKLSSVKLDDVIVPFADDDEQSKFKLDPSVWSNNITHKFLSSPFNFPQPPEMPPSQLRPQSANILKMFNVVSTPPPKKITTLEDIERNMKQKQIKQQQHHHHQQPQQMSPRSLPPGYNMPPQMNRNGLPPHIPHQSQQQPQQQQPLPPPPPPSFNQMPPHPPFNRMPPGYPPFMPPRPPLGSLPIALNNFAMHPSFNAMRPNGPPPPLPFNNHQHPVQNQAQFNQQLLNEIQRNHPLLNRQQPQFQMASFITQQLAQQQQQQQHHHHQLQQHHQHQQQLLHQKSNNNNNNSNAARQQNQRRMQNSNEEYDEYANLMSTRDKHWLIGIQLSQLNSDTPYIDDYYYTTYREREAKKCGDLASKTHKDNQLNHPLTQPKGQHAKLVMVQLGNKNGNRNGQINNNRERRNSENKSDSKENNNMNKSQNPQFENSLGKLQYGSVTAPRKLIDMAIDPTKVRTTTDENQLQHITAAASLELSSQRKYRLILLHIETLYKILLKLEDSMNPTAIIAYAALKESQKEKKEQQMLEGSLENIAASNAANEKIYELEPKEKLIEALLPGITKDKVIGMMNVRKGRNLISRIIPHIAENDIRWVVWSGVFLCMNNSSIKKDKEDNADTIFNAFYPEFKKQISEAPLSIVVKLGQSILAAGESEKKSVNIFSNKLSISSMVALILQAERTFDDPSSTDQLRSEWTQFLKSISSILSKTIQNHTVSVAIESDAITPLREHFSRFKDLKLEPLLNLFSQNDNYNY